MSFKRVSGVYNIGGGPHYGSGLTIDTAAGLYEKNACRGSPAGPATQSQAHKSGRIRRTCAHFTLKTSTPDPRVRPTCPSSPDDRPCLDTRCCGRVSPTTRLASSIPINRLWTPK